MCDMTHSYVRHDSFLCVTWLIPMCDMTYSYVWRDSFIFVPWLIHMCDMTHSYVCHDSSICVPWLVYICDMTHSYVCHDSFICVTWLIHMCDMTHSYVWHDSFICVTWRIHTFSWRQKDTYKFSKVSLLLNSLYNVTIERFFENFLKSQIAHELNLWIEFNTDFWEFSPGNLVNNFGITST